MIHFRRFLIPIVFEDAHILVVNKPAGLASQQGTDNDHCLVDAAQQHLTGTSGTSSSSYVGLVHRLDKPVSGLMVLAKSKQAAQRLSASFSNHSIDKEYLAVVCGTIPGDHVRRYEHMISIDGEAAAKSAVLDLQPVHSFKYSPKKGHEPIPLSVARIRLLTGRKHQIRAQLCHLRWPIFADARYGARYPLKEVNPSKLNEEAIESIALCSHGLRFSHPMVRQEMSFETTPPSKWSKWFGKENMAASMDKLNAMAIPMPLPSAL